MQYDPSCTLNPYSNPPVLCSAIASRTYFDERGRPVRVVNRLGYESRSKRWFQATATAGLA